MTVDIDDYCSHYQHHSTIFTLHKALLLSSTAGTVQNISVIIACLPQEQNVYKGFDLQSYAIH